MIYTSMDQDKIEERLDDLMLRISVLESKNGHKIDDHTEELENRREPQGPVTSKYRRVLSADGRTITSSIIAADGTVRSVRVFEKQ